MHVKIIYFIRTLGRSLKMKKPIFTQASIDFVTKASKQKKVEWLEKNREEYEEVLVKPMRALMEDAAKALKSEARGYRFPLQNRVRIKRSHESRAEGVPFRDWIGVSVSRDSGSRYESCPNLYFEFNHEDILSAGGLYIPSSEQTKRIRQWIDHDPSLLDELFQDKEFKKLFPDFGDERRLKTKPRDYPIDHPRIEWLKLSGFYVWRPFKKKEFFSKNFSELLIRDWHQILKLNRILDKYTAAYPKRIEVVEALPESNKRKMDW